MARETRFSRLSESELYRQMSAQCWKKLDPQTRLELYQEAENRQAAKQGRDPLMIEAFEPVGEKKNLNGYYDRNTPDKLFINARFIDGKPSLLSPKTGADGLNAIFHEGRHAYQYAVAEGRIAVKDEYQRKMWLMNFLMYKGAGQGSADHAVYAQQAVERDARRYAEDELVRIAAIIREESGNVDVSFEKTIYNMRKYEYMVNNIADGKEIMERIDMIDRLARIICKSITGEDVDDVSIYTAYREEFKKRQDILKEDTRVDSVDGLIKKLEEKADRAAEQKKIDAAKFTEAGKRQRI